MLARAQISLALLFTVGFFAVLAAMLLVKKDMSATELTIFTGLVGVLGTMLALILNFFFSRARPQALPDPANTTTQTTTTTTPPPLVVPEGSTVVHAPIPPAAIIPLTSTTSEIPK
jgi:hypothetical protein